jgi:hypothetical protein
MIEELPVEIDKIVYTLTGEGNVYILKVSDPNFTIKDIGRNEIHL